MLHGRGGAIGMPVVCTDEQTAFIVDCYAVDEDGDRLYDSAFYSRPKGTDKSGMAARIDLFEALGPARTLRDEDGRPVFAVGGEVYQDPYGLGFVYEYQPGEPMGQHVKAPTIRCLATEAGQTGNVYDSVYYNLTQGPLAAALDTSTDVGLTRVLLPRHVGPCGGSITPSTAGAASKDGGLETHASVDETHLYVTRELRDMYNTVSRNLVKRRREGTWYLETTTMYRPGEDSIAERTYKIAALAKAGKTKRNRVLIDHRWGEISPEELGDEKKLRAALTEAYGDALSWNDLDGLVDTVLDTRSGVQDSLRYFLNSLTSAEDAWMRPDEWARAARSFEDRETPVAPPAKGDVITLGFDGSRSRIRGITDATAIVATRVSDGLQWTVDVWEQPEGVRGWEVPVGEVEASLAETFRDYTVVGFFADPARWESYVAQWEARWGKGLKAKASAQHPIQYWMTGDAARRTVAALERYRSAVFDGEVVHDDDPTLTRHVLAARMRSSRHGVQIAKVTPDSPHKIDAAIAAVLSWEARLKALAAGAGETKKVRRAPRRIR